MFDMIKQLFLEAKKNKKEDEEKKEIVHTPDKKKLITYECTDYCRTTFHFLHTKSGEKLNILFISDTHGSLKSQKLNDYIIDTKIDLVVGLGDVYHEDWLTIIRNNNLKEVPKIAILGNHDSKNLIYTINNYFGREEILNVDETLIEIDGIRFYGLSGSIKYKNSDTYALLTHRESLEKMEIAPSCDVLITHDGPYMKDDCPTGLYIDAHGGLSGIGYAIKNKKAALVLHGHLHEEYTKTYSNGVIEECLYHLNILTFG